MSTCVYWKSVMIEIWVKILIECCNYDRAANTVKYFISLFYRNEKSCKWLRNTIRIVKTKTVPAGLVCLWPVETEWKLVVKRIPICLQYLLLWAIIMLWSKDFDKFGYFLNGISAYSIFVSFLINAFNKFARFVHEPLKPIHRQYLIFRISSWTINRVLIGNRIVYMLKRLHCIILLLLLLINNDFLKHLRRKFNAKYIFIKKLVTTFRRSLHLFQVK